MGVRIRERLLLDLATVWAALAAIYMDDPKWVRFASEVRAKVRASGML